MDARSGRLTVAMRSRRFMTGLALVCALVGLAASIASLVDYLGASPTFCAESGCATVRESMWAHPLGIPMPVLGIAFFTMMFVLGFVDRRRARLLRTALAISGAAWAMFLIGLQAFSIGAWCKLCMVADPAALALALAVLAGARPMRFTPLTPMIVMPSLAAAIGVLALLTTPPPEDPPPAMLGDTPAWVASAQAAGAATVVEVVDFECPFCREMQRRLETALRATSVPVRIVRKMFPLEMHPHAMPAAVAYCCADAQGKGEAMAQALFAAPPEELTAEGCEKLAASVGCDVEQYRAARGAAETRIHADVADAQAADIHSLPTLFIGGERVVGASKSSAELTAMIERAGQH